MTDELRSTYEYEIPLGPAHLDMATRAVYEFGALQDEWEFGCLLDVVKGAGVRTMVEIGSYTGGSLWAWRQVVPNVLAITLEYHPTMFHSHGASIVFGDSTANATRAALVQRLAGRPVDFVFIDGGHDWPTAHQDFQFARTLVQHGLIGVHDINLHYRYPGAEFAGPRRLWNEYSDKLPTWEIANKDVEDPGVGIFWIR